MSNFKVKQQVRPEVGAHLINGKLFNGIYRLSKAKGIGADFTNANIPVPSGLTDGLLAYNIDEANIQVTASGVWIPTPQK